MKSLAILAHSRPSADEVESLYIHRVNELWRESVERFITESLYRISIDTGMSAASLIPLGEVVYFSDIITSTIVSSRKHETRPGHKKAYGSFSNNNGPVKSMEFGEELGREAYELSFADDVDSVLEFSFKVVVLQHYLHDDAWNSIRAGKEAFLDHWRANYKKSVDPQGILDYAISGRLRK